jgi:hypothetical protein
MEESRPVSRPSRVREVAWILVLMLAAFVGGVFVGLHPNWVPISVTLPVGGSGVAPSDATAPGTMQPTTMPTTQEAQTQPS